MKIILMADIIGSSKRKGSVLMRDFRKVVLLVNKKSKQYILSPLTITLGDEFQGVVKSPLAAVYVIFEMEKNLLSLKKRFQLRYIMQEGDIQTKLNKNRAYEMLGPGLTEAREKLLSMKNSKNRFYVSLQDNDVTEKLNLMFGVLQGIEDQWTPAQQKIVSAFLKFGDYRNVAKHIKKDPTATWRRKKSLMIEEFRDMQKLILLTAPSR